MDCDYKDEDKLYGDKREDEHPPVLNTQEKLREKIKRIEQASGKMLRSAAKMIIGQHASGDEKDKAKVIETLDKAEEELKKNRGGAVSMSDPKARFMVKKRSEKSYHIIHR